MKHHSLAAVDNRLVRLLAADGHEHCRVTLRRPRFRAAHLLVTVDETAPNSEPITLNLEQATALEAYLREAARTRLLRNFKTAKAEEGGA